MHAETGDQLGGGGMWELRGIALYLRGSKVEGMTFAMAECMVEAGDPLGRGVGGG